MQSQLDAFIPCFSRFRQSGAPIVKANLARETI